MSEQTYRRNGFVIGDRSLAPGSGLAATWSGTTSGDAVGDPEATSTARLDRHGRARREGDRALRPDPDAAAGGVADDQARGRAIPAASPTPGPEARLRLLAVQDDALGHGEHLVGAADPASADPAPDDVLENGRPAGARRGTLGHEREEADEVPGDGDLGPKPGTRPDHRVRQPLDRDVAEAEGGGRARLQHRHVRAQARH